MMRSYEFKQEINHAMHETTSWGTYPLASHEEYYHAPPPPPSIQKMLNNPIMPSSYHYDRPQDEDSHYQQVTVHDGRRIYHHDHGRNQSWYGAHHADEKKNKYQGGILRPPLTYLSRHQHHPQRVVDQEGDDHSRYVSHHHSHKGPMTNHSGHGGSRITTQYGPTQMGSRITNYNNKSSMEDFKKIYPHYYYYDDEALRFKSGDDENYIESLIKGMQELGGGKVKKIEVIEYERSTIRGGRSFLVNGYPKSSASSWFKGF